MIREVITNYPGELIQHDSSHHLFAPDAKEKWYLVTSIDDYSRGLLFADLYEKESTWIHIQAVEYVCIEYGFPFKYYPDQHCIFRYVKDRDKNSIHMNFTKFTDDVNPQWKQVLEDCNIQVTYALSPQAKGKIERPYKWLQDHLVRTCLRRGITNIKDAREVLKEEIYSYNYKKIHSTTGEIPMIKFNNAIKENKTLFRPFEIPLGFKSAKDVFCLRETRIADAYRKISFHGLSLKISGVEPRDKIELRLYPDATVGLIEIRFWSRFKLVDVQTIKACDLKINF